MKTLKKNLIIALSVLFLLCGFAFASVNTVKADALDADAFYVETGVDFYATSPWGLRWTVKIGDNVYDGLEENGGYVGVIIAPYAFKTDFDAYVTENPEYEGGFLGYVRDIKGKLLQATYSLNDIGGEAGARYVRLSNCGIRFNNLNLDFIAVAYIADAEDNVVRYSEVTEDHAKNIAETVQAAKEAGLEALEEDLGEDYQAFADYVEETIVNADKQARGVRFDPATEKYTFNGGEYDELSGIKVAASYTVKHVKVVGGEEQEISSEVIENVTVGSQVSLPYQAVEGFMPYGDYRITGTVADDDSLVLTAKYAKAIQIANSDNKATFYPFNNSENFYGSSAIEITQGSFGGKADAYRVYGTTYYTLRVMGINTSYLTANNYNKLRFKVYYPSAEGMSATTNVCNAMINGYYNGGKTAQTHLHIAADTKNNCSYVRIYDENGIRWMSAASDRWFTVEVNLTDFAEAGGLARLNCELALSNDSDTVLYLADFELVNESMDKPSGIAIDSPDGINASFIPRQGSNIGVQENDFIINAVSGTVAGVSDVYSVRRNTANNNHRLGVNGISAADIAQKGITKLTFKVYWPSAVSASSPALTFFGYKNGTTVYERNWLESHLSVAVVREYIRIYNADGTRCYSNMEADKWYDVELNFRDFGDLSGAVEKVIDYNIRMDNGTTVYVADMKFSTDNYYRNSVLIEGSNGRGYLAVQEDKAVNTKIEKVTGNSGVPANGDNEVYSFMHTIANNHKAYLLGVNSAFITANGINKLTFKLYAPAGYATAYIYFQRAGDQTKRINSANMSGYNNIKIFNAAGTRIYDMPTEEWVTVEVSMSGITDFSAEKGLNFSFYAYGSGVATNVNRPLYISEMAFSTAAMS